MGRQRHRGKERKRKSAREEGGERGIEIEPATQSELAPKDAATGRSRCGPQ